MVEGVGLYLGTSVGGVSGPARHRRVSADRALRAHADFSWTKLGVLIFNALIVAYLVRLLLRGAPGQDWTTVTMRPMEARMLPTRTHSASGATFTTALPVL